MNQLVSLLQMQRLKPLELSRLADHLGGLAGYWLRNEIYDALTSIRGPQFPASQLRLPTTCGSCWILMVQPDLQPLPSLRDAFFVPLCWQGGKDWDERLPRQLLDLGQEIADALGQSDRRLRLHPDLQPQPRDLSSLADLRLDFRSAAVSLAGGLYLASRDGEPNPTVAASACWSKQHGTSRVSGLAKKIRTAHEHGIRHFFVAAEQQEEAGEIKQPFADLEIHLLPAGQARLESAIQELVILQKAVPEKPRGLSDQPGIDRNLSHYRFLRLDRDRREQFYQDRLFALVLERFQSLVKASADREKLGRIRALVTIVSGQPNTAILVAESFKHFGVECGLLLATPDMQNYARVIQTAVPDIHFADAAFDGSERLLASMSRQIHSFIGQFAADEMVLDLTGGKTLMKWVADHSMPAKSWRICVETKYEKNEYCPLKEEPMLWQVG